MPGFVQHAKSIDPEELRLDVEKRIANLKFNYQVWEKLLPVLKKWDGKKVTKRLQDAVAKDTGYKVYLDQRIVRQRYLKIEDEKSGQNCRTFIGYEDTFDYKKYVEDYSKADQNCKPSYEKLEGGLKVLPELVQEYNRILSDSQRLVELASTHGLTYDFDILCKER